MLTTQVVRSVLFSFKRKKAVKKMSSQRNSSSRNKKRKRLRRIRQPRVKLRGRRRPNNRCSRKKLIQCSLFQVSMSISTLCQIHSIQVSEIDFSSIELKLTLTYFNQRLQINSSKTPQIFNRTIRSAIYSSAQVHSML